MIKNAYITLSMVLFSLVCAHQSAYASDCESDADCTNGGVCIGGYCIPTKERHSKERVLKDSPKKEINHAR